MQALLAALPAARLRAGAPVVSVRMTRQGAALETTAGPLRTRAVILAVPPPRAAALVEPLDAEAARLLASIPMSSSAIVHLAYRREDVAHRLDGQGLLVPRTEGLRCVACGFASTKFPGRAPEGRSAASAIPSRRSSASVS